MVPAPFFVVLLSMLLAVLPAVAGAETRGPAISAARERRVILFYTAEIHGAVEPCGCTSDPLGDVSRLAALVADARRAGPGAAPGVALVDAGGLLYPDGDISARERPSADLRAAFLGDQLERIGLAGATLGETDVAGGAAPVRPARLASNLAGASASVRPPHVEKLGQVAIGVLGIADPAAASGLKAESVDPGPAARRDVDALRRGGAEVVVLLAAVDKAAARKLAREAGADIVIVGKRVGAGMSRPEVVGRALLVAPSDEMQRVGRLEIVLRGPARPGLVPALQDAGGAQAAQLRRTEIDRALERLQAGFTQWTGGQGGTGSGTGAGAGTGAADSPDATFLAAKKREQRELEAERAQLGRAWAPPEAGNYVVNTLVPLRRTLRRDPKVVAAMKSLDQRIAALNLRHATPPPAAEPGRATFVGIARCTGCHAEATRFWKQTVHAHAWKTLVDGGKQADYKCTGCHVTGFGQVGGSSLGFTRKLESVQCETCHGPGSLHVLGEGNEEPLAIKRDSPETVCVGCHTEQHSDTFTFEPYLRDIVGPGHGARRRQLLGPGPTGHQLRSAALAKAKLAGAEQIKKM